MNDIYLVDAVFLARRPIRSLPEFHGARWSAWLRHACRQYGVTLDAILKGIMPLRSGQRPILTGEIVVLRLVAGDPGSLAPLAGALAHTACHGEFSPQSLELLFWHEALSGKKHAPGTTPLRLARLEQAGLKAQVAQLCSLDSFTLVFHSPLRLKLPAAMRRGASEVESYCQPDFFSSGQAVAYLAEKVRFWPFPEEPPKQSDLEIATSDLAWRDLRYNRERRIALGGLIGQLSCKGPIGPILAQRLVLGQYLGAGKNPLFGLGYWRIPELAEAGKF